MEDIRLAINQHKTDKIRVEKVYAMFSKLTDLLQNLCSRIDTLESAPVCSGCCSMPIVDVDVPVAPVEVPVPEDVPVAPVEVPVEVEAEAVTEVEVLVEPLASEGEPVEVETPVDPVPVEES